jgi:hypothetical protein
MAKIKPVKVEIMLLETLLTVVKKSAGTKMFQTIYAKVNGRKKDITEDGNLSCAFYVSNVLATFGLIDQGHSTVSGTITAMQKAGWQETKKLKPGVVIVWDKPTDGSFQNKHIGFYIGDDQAVSNIWQKKTPGIHHVTFGKEGSKKYRPILGLFSHPQLK